MGPEKEKKLNHPRIEEERKKTNKLEMLHSRTLEPNFKENDSNHETN